MELEFKRVFNTSKMDYREANGDVKPQMQKKKEKRMPIRRGAQLSLWGSKNFWGENTILIYF